MPKNSVTSSPEAMSRKNLSDYMKESFVRYAQHKVITKIVPFVADNVFFVTTKTVDARLHDGNWMDKEVKDWLRYSKDEILAIQLKHDIDECLKP